MFGYGWNIPQERYIQLFADFTMTDFQANGSRVNYKYTKNNPDLQVESFDGDSTIYYPLNEGSYTVEDPQQKTELTRRGPDDYLLVDPARKEHLRLSTTTTAISPSGWIRWAVKRRFCMTRI